MKVVGQDAGVGRVLPQEVDYVAGKQLETNKLYFVAKQSTKLLDETGNNIRLDAGLGIVFTRVVTIQNNSENFALIENDEVEAGFSDETDDSRNFQ